MQLGYHPPDANIVDEIGPALLLPNGEAIFFGATGATALYDPSTGNWTQGPSIVDSLGAPQRAGDVPGTVETNGDVLFEGGQAVSSGASDLFEYDPTANTITQINNPADASFNEFLDLPNGQILGDTADQLWLYTPNPPSAANLASWQPTISSITNDDDGTYTLTGTQLSGLDEGSAYGDDLQCATNYPIVRVTDMLNGNVYYADTYDCHTTVGTDTPQYSQVATGSAEETATFVLPNTLGNDPYSLQVVANGIPSAPVDSSPAYFVDASAPPSGNGLSWATAFNTVQQAIAGESSVVADRVPIYVAQGTYYPSASGDSTATLQLMDNVEIRGGYAGNESDFPFTRSVSGTPTILSGNINGDETGNSYHVVTGTGADSAAVLDGFTIEDGDAPSEEAAGGGFYDAFDGSPTIKNCIFLDNYAAFGGGAVYDNSSSSPAFLNCTFTGNSATFDGGAIYNVAGSSPSLTNCSFDDNSAGYGGAIYNTGSAPILADCLFSENTAVEGGAMFTDGSVGAQPSLNNCIFLANTSTAGGALFDSSSSPALINCTLTGNSATSSGGALYDQSGSEPVVTNCILWDDSASAGGEIYNDGSSTSTVTYSDVDQSGYGGSDNDIESDPLFNQSPAMGNPGNLGLQPDSPCIDVGNTAAVEEMGITTDFRGNPRVFNDVVDMGAYEFVDVFWTGDGGDENWGNPDNWSTGYVPGQYDTVIFDSGTAGVAGQFAVDSLTLQNGTSLSLVGAGSSLTLDGASTFAGDSHMMVNVNTTLILNSESLSGDVIGSGTVNINSGSGNLAASLGSSLKVVLNSTGVVTLTGVNTYTGRTTINAGTLVIPSVTALPSGTEVVNNATLSVLAGTSSAPVVLGGITGGGALTVGNSSGSITGYVQLFGSGSGSSGTDSTMGALVVNSGSTLDIKNNRLFVNYGSATDPMPTILGYLASGYDSGQWNGTGIVSSTAAVSIYSIGYLDGGNLVDFDWSSQHSTEPVQANQIELMYTVAGDSNLKGGVGSADLLAVVQHFNHTGTDWAEGNFTYITSGPSTTSADLLVVIQHFNRNLFTDWTTTSSTFGIGLSVTVLADGEILIAGGADNGDIVLLELNSDGSINTSFGTGGVVLTDINGYASGNSVDVMGDGNIVVAGCGTDPYDGDQDVAVAEFTSNGSRVTSFGDGGVALSDVGCDGDTSAAFAMTVLVNGDILVAGGDNNGVVLEEFTSGGVLDDSFGTNGVVWNLPLDPFTAYTLTVLSDGNILVAGGDGTNAVLAQFNADGSLDTSFGSGGIVVTSGSNCWQSVTVLSGGEILAVGVSGENEGEIVLGEFNSNGSANTAFGSGGLSTFQEYGTYLAVTLSVLTNGEILIGGLATDPIGDGDVILVEFTSAGQLDTGYGDDGTYVTELSSSYDPWAMASDGSGGVLVVGSNNGKLFVADFNT